MNGHLAGGAVLVTGGAAGIGAELCCAFADQGAAVAVCDIADPAAVVGGIVSRGGRAYGGMVDVSDGPAVAGFVAAAQVDLGPITSLVNNAGIFTSLAHKPFTEVDADEFDKVMAVNVRGVFECAKAVVPGMRAAGGGTIVNIASTTVHSGTPGLLHYVASKGAVIAMTRSMARELGDSGIRVNAVAPGLVSDEGVKNNAQHAGLESGAISRRTIKRAQEPADLVGPVVFLAGEESGFMTGQTIVVDGGAFMQ